MARGSANNVVESKTRAKKGVPVKDSKKVPTAVEKAANTRKAERPASAKKSATKTSNEATTSTAAENEEKKKTVANTIKAGSKKNEKEVSKNIKKVETPTSKVEKTSRKRKIEEADLAVNDKPAKNESGEKVDDKQLPRKRTKTNPSSDVTENLPSKVTKKNAEIKKIPKVANVKAPVRKARNAKKGVVENELNSENMELPLEAETKSKKSKVDSTQDINVKKTSAATKSSNKTSKKESNTIAEKGKKSQTVSQRMRNVKKTVIANDKNQKIESSDKEESENSESCDEVPVKETQEGTESKFITKGKKSNLENTVRKTRNTKKPQEQNLSKNTEVGNQVQEKEDTDIVLETDESNNKKVQIKGRGRRNAKKTEEAEPEKLDQNIEVETSNEKVQVLDVGKSRGFKRGANRKSDNAGIVSKAFENSINVNEVEANESLSETENVAFTEKKTKQKLLEKKDDSDAVVSSRKGKRGSKVVPEGESTEKIQISADEENSNTNSSDTLKAVLARKTRRGGKAVAEEESTQISTEIKDLDEDNSNSNLSNMADPTKTAPLRTARRGRKGVAKEESTLMSTEVKDVDDANSNSNLPITEDSTKTAPTPKVKRGAKVVSGEDSTLILTEISDLDEDNSNSNLADSVKTAPTTKGKRGRKPIAKELSTQIPTEVKDLDEDNSNSNMEDSTKTAPTIKAKRGRKAIAKEGITQIPTEVLDEDNSNSKMEDSTKTAPTIKAKRGRKAIAKEGTTQIPTEDLNEDNSISNMEGSTETVPTIKGKRGRKAIAKEDTQNPAENLNEENSSNREDSIKTAPTMKAKRGRKPIAKEEPIQISTEIKNLEEENSNSNLSNMEDSTQTAPARKSKRGGKAVIEQEPTQSITEIMELDEDNSNSNLLNMADSAKTSTIRKTRRGIKLVPDEKSMDQIHFSAEIKDDDEENSNSNLSATADSVKTLSARKTRGGIKNVSDEKSINEVQILGEVKDIDEEHSNSNSSSAEDLTKVGPAQMQTPEQMQISAEINSDGVTDLSNIADATAAASSRKTRRGAKTVPGGESSEEKQISTEVNDEVKDTSNLDSVVCINKNSIESPVIGRTRSGSLSKQKSEQLTSEEQLRSEVHSDMNDSIDNKPVDENLVHDSEKELTEISQISVETKDSEKDNGNLNDFSTFNSPIEIQKEIIVSEDNSTKQMSEKNCAGSTSNALILKDDTTESIENKTIETDQSSMTDPKNVKIDSISGKLKATNEQVNKSHDDEENYSSNRNEVIQNLSCKSNVFADSNSESTESDSKENLDSKVSVDVNKEVKNTVDDEKNEPNAGEHKDCYERENCVEMAAEKLLEQNETETVKRFTETDSSSDDIQSVECENMISDVNLNQAKIIEQQKGKELKNPEEAVGMKIIETNKSMNEVLEEHELANRKNSTEVFNKQDPKVSVEVNKLDVKVSEDVIDTSKDAVQITEEDVNKSSLKESVVISTSVNVVDKCLESSTEIDKRILSEQISLGCILTSDGERTKLNKDMEISEKCTKELFESENFQNTEISNLKKEVTKDMDQNTEEFSLKKSCDFHVKDANKMDEFQPDEIYVEDEINKLDNVDEGSNSESLETKGSSLFSKTNVDLSISNIEFKNDQNIYLDERNSCINSNENENSDKEVLMEDKVEHSTNSLLSSSKLLEKTSALSEQDLFHTSADCTDSNSQLSEKDIGTSQEQKETIPDQYQLEESSNDCEKQKLSLDAAKEPEKVCGNDGEFKESSIKGKELDENSVLGCEQMNEISAKSDQEHNETHVSNQCDSTFIDNNKEQFSNDIDNEETSSDAVDNLDKTSVDDAEQLSQMSNDDYRQNASVDDEEFIKSSNEEYCEESPVDHHMSKDDLAYADNQQLENILRVENDKEINEKTIEENECEKTSTENGSSNEEVINDHVQLDEELADNQKLTEEMDNGQSDEAVISDGELKNQSLAVFDEQISFCEEKSDNSTLNVSSVNSMQLDETLADRNKQLSQLNEEAVIRNEEVKNLCSPVNSIQQLNAASIDKKELVEASVDSQQLNDSVVENEELLEASAGDSQHQNDSSVDNEGLLEASIENSQQSNDPSVDEELLETSVDECQQLNEASVDNEELLESSIDNSQQLIELSADNEEEASADESQQLNDASTEEGQQLSETLLDNIQLLERSADDREQSGEASISDKEQLKELPVLDSGQLDSSHLCESEQLDKKSVDADKPLNEILVINDIHASKTSVGDGVQLKVSSTNHCLQLEESSNSEQAHLEESSDSESVQCKESSNCESVQLTQSSSSESAQLKESSIDDGVQLKELLSDDDAHLNNLEVGDDVHVKESSTIEESQMNKENSDDTVKLNETSVICCEQSKESSKESDNQFVETFNSDNVQVNETNCLKTLHSKIKVCDEKICLKNTDEGSNQVDTSGVVSDKIADDPDISKDACLIQITEQTNENNEFLFSKKSEYQNNSKEIVCNQSSTIEYHESVKISEGNVCERNISDESRISVMSPKNQIICEEQNLDESKLSSCKDVKDIENKEISPKKDCEETSKISNEYTLSDHGSSRGETDKGTFSSENKTDLNKMPGSSKKSFVEDSAKVSHNRESSLSTCTKIVDSETFSIVKKDGNRKKTKLVKSSGYSKQINNEELKRFSSNQEQSRSRDIVSSRKSVKRKSESPENTISKTGSDSSTEISLAIKIKKKKEESMSETEEKMVRSLLSPNAQYLDELENQDSHCRSDPSEPGPSRVETEAELNSRKRKATSSSSSQSSNEAKKSKIKNSSIPVRMYLEQFVPFLLEGLLKITYVRPEDPIQYLADWMKENKAAAYRRMGS